MSRARDAGFGLVELVAVLAVFSIVAVMALQGLSGAMRARERLDAAETASAALAGAASLLRRDLQAMAPVPGPDGAPAFVADAGGLALTLAGQPDFPDGARGGLTRVTWRLDDGRLGRSVQPFDAAEATGSVLLDGVADWQVRSRDATGTWRDGASPGGGALRLLPTAVEVGFALPGLPDLRLLVAR